MKMPRYALLDIAGGKDRRPASGTVLLRGVAAGRSARSSFALAILLIPKLGAATFLALLVAGQMLCALAFDHFGLLGIPVQPASLIRLAGAAFLILGVVMIRM
jgi:uncharacterized membrane protein YdcZ (DUF606 family)